LAGRREILLLGALDRCLELLDRLPARLELVDPRAEPREDTGQLVLADAVPPRERLDPGEARLDGFEPLRIGLETIPVVDQREGRLAQLDLDVRERLRRLAQRVVVLDEPLDLLPGARGERMRADLALVERLDRRLEAAGELVHVREARAFGAEARGLGVLERERLELRRVEACELELGVALRVAAAQALEPLLERAPCAKRLGDVGRERLEAAVRVEQRALIRALEQRLVRMLPVDIDEQRAETLQILERHRLVVDERARSSLLADDPAQEAAVLVVEAELLEERERGVAGRAFEQHADLGPLGAVAHGARVGPVAEREAERVDEDRLAGAGLAGHDREAGVEFELDLV